MGISDKGMQRIREAAATTGVLRPHGLTVKDGNNNRRKRRYTHGATMHSDDGGVDDDETANVTTSEGVEMAEQANECIVDGATIHSDDGGVDDDETANVTTCIMDSGDGCDCDGRMQNKNMLFSTESVAAGNDNEYEVSVCKRLSILDVCVIFDNDSSLVTPGYDDSLDEDPEDA